MSCAARNPGRWALVVAHNEAPTVRSVVEGLVGTADQILVVDDGSTDGTLDRLAGLPVQTIRNDQNLGKGRRLSQGLDHAFSHGARMVVTLDADLQHDPADVPRFWARAEASPDALVIGDRSGDSANMPRLRALSIRFGNFFIGMACKRRIGDAQCGMRVYPHAYWETVDVPERDKAHFVYETAALMHAAGAGLPFEFVPVAARYAGFVQRPSHFRPLVDFIRITRCVTLFLLRPRTASPGRLHAAREDSAL